MNTEQDVVHIFYNWDVLCDDCRKQMSVAGMTFSLGGLSCESLYVYEGVVKDILIQYKELMDEALYPVFLYPYIQYLRKKYKGYSLVVVPSSDSAYKRRGFSHVEKMFGVLGLPIVNVFSKDEIVQKKVTFKERTKIQGHIHMDGKIPQTPLLIVDDMCTTGSTLLAVYEHLKEHPYPVKALTFCCHAKYVEIRRWKRLVIWLWELYTQVV